MIAASPPESLLHESDLRVVVADVVTALPLAEGLAGVLDAAERRRLAELSAGPARRA